MSFLQMSLAGLLLALPAEAAFGYPAAVFARLGHPVVLIGTLIDFLDRRLNRPGWTFGQRRAAGVAALLAVLAVVGTVAGGLAAVLRAVPFGFAVEAALAATLLAQRSLDEHVRAVAQAFGDGGLEAGRRAVSRIVGRDPASLDRHGVCRAAVESLAENFSDGVVAPAFWFAVGGLPGIALYKAINTADSMIGHRSERHRAFGWAAARLDDFVNLPASRLAGCLLALAAATAGRGRAAFRTMLRDAGRHRSPNAGWPEAATAGALGLRLAGPRVYGAGRVEDPWLGDGRAEAEPGDILGALGLYRRACLGLWAAVALAFAATLA